MRAKQWSSPSLRMMLQRWTRRWRDPGHYTTEEELSKWWSMTPTDWSRSRSPSQPSRVTPTLNPEPWRSRCLPTLSRPEDLVESLCNKFLPRPSLRYNTENNLLKQLNFTVHDTSFRCIFLVLYLNLARVSYLVGKLSIINQLIKFRYLIYSVTGIILTSRACGHVSPDSNQQCIQTWLEKIVW